MAKKGQVTTTEPLRTKEEIQGMINAITPGRNRLMFLLGINSALRVSDLVKMRVDDFDFTKDTFRVREKKTSKIKTCQLCPQLAHMIHDYVVGRNLKDSDWVFRSRQLGGHISTTRVREIITDAAKVCGIKHVSTHTMRKTFGYQAYKAGKPFAAIMAAFNHSDPKVTMRYLCIDEDEVNAMTSSMSIGF